MWPHGPVWERQGARSARPHLLHPLPAGPGPGHRGRCYGWWSPVPGGSAPLMGEPGCDWKGRRGAPVGYPSCGQRRTSQRGTPRQAKSPVPLILHCPEIRNFSQPRAQRQGELCKEAVYRTAPSGVIPPYLSLLQTLPAPNCPYPSPFSTLSY